MKHQREADAVLSSVRRLVSENSGAPDSSDSPRLAEKLLLTPALRVDEPPRQPAEPTFSRQRREPSPLELRIAELERAVGNQPGDWEPDGSETTDEETPKRFVFQHDRGPREAVQSEAVTEAPVLNGTAQRSVDDELSERIVAQAMLESFRSGRGAEAEEDDAPIGRRLDTHEIEEDQLRELVAQMVRAELQGELGERITRNVRKLVRREIHRALLTHDLG